MSRLRTAERDLRVRRKIGREDFNMGNRSTILFLMAAALGVSALAPTPAVGQRPGTGARDIPRTHDGKPDFTGVWAGPAFVHAVTPDDTDTPRVTIYDRKKMAPFIPGGQALMSRKLSGNARVDDPTAFCLPNGLTRQILAPYAQQWIQAPGYIVSITEYMHFVRVIPLDGRPHPPDVEPTWMGDSVGRWEGDTLVIDTIGLKEWMLDANQNINLPDENGTQRWHTDALHVVERLKHINATTVSYEVTIDDPKIWTRPWSQEFQMSLHPKWRLFEFVCEENNRCEGGKCVDSDVPKTLK